MGDWGLFYCKVSVINIVYESRKGAPWGAFRRSSGERQAGCAGGIPLASFTHSGMQMSKASRKNIAK